MYFLKKNILNIIICMLSFGVLATVVNFFIPPSSTTYEEYYTLETALEPNSIADLNILLNDTINNSSDNIHVAELYGQTNSNLLQLTITTESGINYDSIHSQVHDILESEGFVITENVSQLTYETSNEALQIIIVMLGLIIGTVVGIILAVNNNNINTEEDIQYYLNERTLGTF